MTSTTSPGVDDGPPMPAALPIHASADADGADPPPPRTGWVIDGWPAYERAMRRIGDTKAETWVTFAVVLGCVLFVFNGVHPELIFRDSTPTGGDMGSHLWGPNYLMHHLLPHGRISGWTPDWYAGFPAFQFYMVLPALFVVALNAGVRSPLLVPVLAMGLGVLVSGWVVPALHRWRRLLFGVGIAWLVLTIPVPYNVSFKLVTVSGLLALPVTAWAFGKLSGLPFPVPPMLSLGTLYMIYNREPTLNSGTGNIIGGNMASTMAGEFAFSISLAFCVLYMGFLVNGLRTGRHRRTAAVLLAVTGLCHLIPVFFALGVTVIALVVWPGRQRLRWALPMLPVAGLLSAFWVVPFLLRHPFVNDMGWEKLPQAGSTNPDNSPQTIWNYLIPHALWWPIAFAAVGLVVSIIYRHRVGYLLAAATAASGLAFVWMPQARLWNARVLPFFYLSLFLLAAIGVGEVVRSVATLLARDPEHPGTLSNALGVGVCALFTLVFLGVPLGRLPGVTHPASGGTTFLSVFHRAYRNDVPGWAQWNYEGLEGKQPAVGDGGKAPAGQGGWPEFHAMVQTMDRLGKDPGHGCGRAFWEYGERLETYGTPMAPMLLPYFTNSCIGSMEGLYFESSTTTPYHFLTQCELSEKGSCAQRDLAYNQFDHELGIKQLELLGVKYYMAFSPTAVEAADADPTLKEVAVSGPWHVYELDRQAAALVTPLKNQPVVMSNVGDGQNEWLDPAAAWFLQSDKWDVMLTRSGPKEWKRVVIPADPVVEPTGPAWVSLTATARADLGLELAGRPPGDKRRIGARTLPKLPATPVSQPKVSNITTGDDRISFDVDRVGSPVLVKVSYFPNWEVSGGKGPYRVAPNLMVVVPTSNHVSLHFGRTGVDWLAIALTLMGLAGLVGMARLATITMPEPKVRPPRPRPVPAAGPGPDPAAPGTVPSAAFDFEQWIRAVAPPDLGDPAAPPPDPSPPPAAGDRAGDRPVDPEG